MNKAELIEFYQGLLDDWGGSNRNVKRSDNAILWQFNNHYLTVGVIKQTLRELRS